MIYKNRDNFVGLLRIADRLSGDPLSADLVIHCREREAGFRKVAFVALSRFLDKVEILPRNERSRLADVIFSAADENPKAHQFFSHPLTHRFLFPALTEWLAAEPDSIDALRWDGIHRANREAFQRVLVLDPSDVIARRHLLYRDYLARIDFELYHYGEARRLMNMELIVKWFAEGEHLLSAAPDPTIFSKEAAEFEALRKGFARFVQCEGFDRASFPRWRRLAHTVPRPGQMFPYDD